MEQAKIKVIVRNRKAHFEYTIVQSFEAGIVLQGTEVKSLRAGKCNLTDGFVEIINGEAWLKSVHISEYSQGNINNHDPFRDRKLLLNAIEIKKLNQRVKEKGYTIVPLSLYLKNGKVKVEIALAKGKKLYDKREAIAKKDMERESRRKEL
ncbi:MAG: SsrA-binding protein [Ignavibacteriaceae bacterium]|nr:MAG: SsrA-binding protein [Ignavibacteriaceae bacterium]